MTADWMSHSIADSDNEESRSARDRPLRMHWSHPITCRCRECFLDEYEPGDGQ